MSTIARRLYAAWLRWCIACNEDYMRDCARVGIADTASLREWRKQADAMRVQIALMETAP